MGVNPHYGSDAKRIRDTRGELHMETRGYWVYHQYMSWIDERLAERKALAERNRLLDDHAVSIYTAVWDEMMKLVEEAKTKGFALFPRGTLQKRHILWAVPSNDRTLNFTMVDKRQICATGDGVDLLFELDICDGGVVCLKHKSTQVSEQETTRLILDPCLFPELVTAQGKSVYETRGIRTV